jgi:hypothetical protein
LIEWRELAHQAFKHFSWQFTENLAICHQLPLSPSEDQNQLNPAIIHSSYYVLFKGIVFLFYSPGNNFYVSGLDSLADIV